MRFRKPHFFVKKLNNYIYIYNNLLNKIKQMQDFYINQNSENPVLRMELICDGKFDYKKTGLFNNSIQNSEVVFSMKNIDNGMLKVSKSKAEIVESGEGGCETKFLLQYSWKKRDVSEKGSYKAWFEIKFNNDLYENNVEYPSGNLIVPIENELIVHVL